MPAIEPFLDALAGGEARVLHLRGGDRPCWRVDRDLVPNGAPLPCGAAFDSMLEELAQLARLAPPESGQDAEFGISSGGRWFSVRILAAADGRAAIITKLPQRIPTPEELGLPEYASRAVLAASGLVLLVGNERSGKSTSAASLAAHAASKSPRYILAVQRAGHPPLDSLVPRHLSVVHALVIGQDTATCASGLRTAIEVGADMVVIDELRTPESASLALELAEGGALVLATLHAHSLVEGLGRLLSLLEGSGERAARALLADHLRLAMHQTLVVAKKGGLLPLTEAFHECRAAADALRAGRTADLPALFQGAHVTGAHSQDVLLEELVRTQLLEREEALRRTWNRSRLEQKTVGTT